MSFMSFMGSGKDSDSAPISCLTAFIGKKIELCAFMNYNLFAWGAHKPQYPTLGSSKHNTAIMLNSGSRFEVRVPVDTIF